MDVGQDEVRRAEVHGGLEAGQGRGGRAGGAGGAGGAARGRGRQGEALQAVPRLAAPQLKLAIAVGAGHRKLPEARPATRDRGRH